MFIDLLSIVSIGWLDSVQPASTAACRLNEGFISGVVLELILSLFTTNNEVFNFPKVPKFPSQCSTPAAPIFKREFDNYTTHYELFNREKVKLSQIYFPLMGVESFDTIF